MTNPNLDVASAADAPQRPFFFATDFQRDLNIKDRTVRDYRAREQIPPPDGMIGKRHFWTRETYERFMGDVRSGALAMPGRELSPRRSREAA